MREQDRKIIADPFMEINFAFRSLRRKIRRNIAYSKSHNNSPFSLVLGSTNGYRYRNPESIAQEVIVES
jgi:hypothetical protein